MTQAAFVNKATEVDPREAKLPAWARDKLNVMRRATLEARRDLADLRGGTKRSPFWLEDYEDQAVFFLPAGCRIMFGTGGKSGELQLYLDSRNNSDALTVMGIGGGPLAISPHSSNVVTIRTPKR